MNNKKLFGHALTVTLLLSGVRAQGMKEEMKKIAIYSGIGAGTGAVGAGIISLTKRVFKREDPLHSAIMYGVAGEEPDTPFTHEQAYIHRLAYTLKKLHRGGQPNEPGVFEQVESLLTKYDDLVDEVEDLKKTLKEEEQEGLEFAIEEGKVLETQPKKFSLKDIFKKKEKPKDAVELLGAKEATLAILEAQSTAKRVEKAYAKLIWELHGHEDKVEHSVMHRLGKVEKQTEKYSDFFRTVWGNNYNGATDGVMAERMKALEDRIDALEKRSS